jgi:hypothetical protein
MDSTPHQKTLIGIWVKKEDPKVCCLQETHELTETNIVLGWQSGRFTRLMAPQTRQEYQYLHQIK